MKHVFLCLALGVFAATAASAQAPHVVNGKIDSRSVRTGLARTVDELASAQAPAWIGYTVDAVGGSYGDCWECGPGSCGTVYLEGRQRGAASERPEAAAARPLAILLRSESGVVGKIRFHQSDCDVDAGGLAVHWLTDVDAAESVAMLARYVTKSETAAQKSVLGWSPALSAIALHATPAAQGALERFVSAGQPLEIRKRAAFWLGSARGSEGFAVDRRLSESDPDDGFRKELTFAVSVSHEPGALDALIRMAKSDSNSVVRQQAIFWLGQKAGEKVAGTLADSASRDPETANKERAVFALSRMPNGEGVPKLIEVARTNADPVVRKRAVFWLGQSKDPRALDFLLEVLGK